MDRQAILQRNYSDPSQVPPLLCPECGSREDVSLTRISMWQEGAAVYRINRLRCLNPNCKTN